MKISKILLMLLALCVASTLVIGCRSGAASRDATGYQTVTVQRGDLTIDVIATGNLVFSYQEELAFEVPGIVGEVLVEVGDSVEEGQVLAKLDPESADVSLISLQVAVTQARIDLRNAEEDLEKAQNPYTGSDIAQAEAAVANAKVALEAAQEALEGAENPYTESDITKAELAVINAQLAVENPHTELDIAQAEAAVANARVTLEAAQAALEKAENPYTESEIVQAELAVVNARLAVEKAEEDLNFARAPYGWRLDAVLLDIEQKQKQLAIAEFDLAEAEENLAEIHAGADPLEVAQKQKQLAVAEASLSKAEDDLGEILGSVDSLEFAIAEFNLADAEEALAEMEAGADPLEVEQKQKQLAVAEASLGEAEDDLAEMSGSVDSLEVELEQLEVAAAQAALDKAIERLETATIVAPFNGIVTSVNVDPGEEVNANQVVIVLVDPNKFEAEILVNEMDILQMQVGAPATIEVEAIAGISLPARVTSISPTAIILQGVVNYKVTVELESLESLMSELEPPAASEEGQQPQATPGSIDEALDKAVKEGGISQQQADMMKERMQEQFANLSEEEIEQFMERFPEGAEMRQRPMGMILETIKLREGLTVAVSIIIQERHDVLLVPNQAIIGQGRATFVQVLEDDVIQKRPVITGLSDWQYTEIIEGLSEGEQVVIPQTTGTSTTPTMPEHGAPSFQMFPGMGR